MEKRTYVARNASCLKWLKNKENLRYLHERDDCTCEYTAKELDYHKEFMTLLVMSGNIQIEQRDEQQFESEYESTESSTFKNDAQDIEPSDASIPSDQNRKPDSQSLNQSINLTVPEQSINIGNERTKCPCSCSCALF